jgi:HEAT repeat protein
LALGELGDKRTVEPLIAALQDEDESVREIAAGTLGRLGDERAVDPLTAALQDKNRFVREAAARALEKIQQKDGDGSQRR